MSNFSNIKFDRINEIAYAEEAFVAKELMEYLQSDYKSRLSNIKDRAEQIINDARKSASSVKNPIDNLLQEYQLNTQEGTILLCLAEALLRIPDKKTTDRLLEDKFSSTDWKKHTGFDKGLFVNASSWAFFLTGNILKKNDLDKQNIEETYKSLIKKSSEPLFRNIVKQAVMILAKQFVFKPKMDEAIKFTSTEKYKKNIFSFDMLGEGARTMEDGDRFFEDYKNSIKFTGEKLNNDKDIRYSNGVSIKISALHPRYERNKIDDLIQELLPKLINLCELAKKYNIQLCIDAEENYRLILSLKLLEKLSSHKNLKDWNGLGLAVQAYQKRAFYVIDWINELAKRDDRIISVRLVKGAYWDSEIKLGQELGIKNYPVFTRKSLTDLSWMACALKLFKYQNTIFPAFATHNAYSIAFIEEFGKDKIFEFQRIHGMADIIHNYFNNYSKDNYQKCRIYAPVGNYDDLLPYLMRRLLENGANTSFVNKLNNPKLKNKDILSDPIDTINNYEQISNPQIPLPPNIYLPERENSKGYDLDNEYTREKFMNIFDQHNKNYVASSLINNVEIYGDDFINVLNPANLEKVVGKVSFANENIISQSITNAANFYPLWKDTSINKKAKIVKKFAELLEENTDELVKLCVEEAGKTIKDAINDIREAVDFCYYYSSESIKLFSKEKILNGPTGEKNKLIYEGKGVIFAISPWNFPIAIFVGQIVSSLLSGNTVIAKPAEQTSIIGYKVSKLLFESGLPPQALQLLLGQGEKIGPFALDNKNIKGVVFTGSCETSKIIQSQLNKRDEIITFSAETGGQNFMIIDSSALTEQVIDDAIESGFNSTGQRCSALRILAIQDEVYEKTIKMLIGATHKIKIGLPNLIETDIGPVIDFNSKKNIENHINKFKNKILTSSHFDKDLNGYYVSPTIIEINDLKEIKEEIFGPVIHVYKYKAKEIEKLIKDINNMNYGLTLGIQSRIETTINYIFRNANIGNIYINRNITGAIVGVQPFGGRGLSGTGPKAGGPNYLLKFVNEKTYSYDTTSAGGNASLFMLSDNQ